MINSIYFAKTVGWDKFEFSIIEICDLNLQQEKENCYLQKYLPLLNSIWNIKKYTIRFEFR